MSYILRPRRWLRQPPYPWELDSGNALIRDLMFAYSFGGHTLDAVRRDIGVMTAGVDPGYTPSGRSVNVTGSNNARVTAKSTGAILGGSVDLTIVAGVVMTSSGPGANGGSMYCERGSAGNDILKITNKAGLGFSAVYRNDGGTLIQLDGTSSVNDGSFQHGAIRKIGTAWTTWHNKVNEASGTFGSASDAFTDATNEAWIGCDKGDPFQAQAAGHILYCYGWKRGLDAVEIAALADNPWQIFRPVQRRVYVNTAGSVRGSNYYRHVARVGA